MNHCKTYFEKNQGFFSAYSTLGPRSNVFWENVQHFSQFEFFFINFKQVIVTCISPKSLYIQDEKVLKILGLILGFFINFRENIGNFLFGFFYLGMGSNFNPNQNSVECMWRQPKQSMKTNRQTNNGQCDPYVVFCFAGAMKCP